MAIHNVTLEEIAKIPVDGTAFASQNGQGNLLDLRTQDKVKNALTAGYLPAVERAENFIEQVERSMPELPQAGGFMTVRSPYGGRADMGDWLAGSPTPMRRRVKRLSDIAPIRIVVGNFVSYGVSAEDYARRSEAIIALVLLIQRYRPVDVICSIESKHYGRGKDYGKDEPVFGLLALESRPVNLSQIGFVIGHPAFSRVCGFDWLRSKGVEWGIPCPSFSIQQKREFLNLSEQDIYVDSLALYDPLQSDPLGWIKREIGRIVGIEAEAYNANVDDSI